MHKATFLEGSIHLAVEPDGPILIKAGESGSGDPTLPDMEFVRTRRNGREQVYLPGSSLKGVVRAQAERICRSLDRQGRDPSRDDPPLADNPLGDKTTYSGVEDITYNSGRYIESIREQIREHPDRTALIYRRTAFVAQLFGHTSLAARLRFADAYAANEPELEERNGVAIDRIYGSVAFGPFNYEVAVAGTFVTRIDFKNVTLAHLALLGLALRDLAEGRVALGFGKSRGLGRVRVEFQRLELRYPTCELVDATLRLLNGRHVAQVTELAGLGALCQEPAYESYRLPSDDRVLLPPGLAYVADDLLGVRLLADGDEQVRAIWRACMPAWRREIGL